MKSSVKLSIALATRNEEENLARCLESVKGIAGEIVIADAHSSDRTREIAESFGAKIILVAHDPMFHKNKQHAIDACHGDWVLMLDADEVLSPELETEIRSLIERNQPPVISSSNLRLFMRHAEVAAKKNAVQYSVETEKTADAYFIPRLNYFLGGYLRHGGVYPDSVIRLFRFGKASWPCRTVHEQMAVKGTVGFLSGSLIHYSDPTLARYWKRANRYTSETAVLMRKRNHPTGFLQFFNYLFWRPMSRFLLLYIRHKGFLDGFSGFFWALFSALHDPIAYLKYLELRRA